MGLAGAADFAGAPGLASAISALDFIAETLIWVVAGVITFAGALAARRAFSSAAFASSAEALARCVGLLGRDVILLATGVTFDLALFELALALALLTLALTFKVARPTKRFFLVVRVLPLTALLFLLVDLIAGFIDFFEVAPAFFLIVFFFAAIGFILHASATEAHIQLRPDCLEG